MDFDPFFFTSLLDKENQHLTPEQAEALLLKSSLTNQNLLNLKHFDLVKFKFIKYVNEDTDDYEFIIWRDVNPAVYNCLVKKIDISHLSFKDFYKLQSDFPPRIYKIVVNEDSYRLNCSVTCYRKVEENTVGHVVNLAEKPNYSPCEIPDWHKLRETSIPEEIAKWLKDYATGEVSASIADKRLYQ